MLVNSCVSLGRDRTKRINVIFCFQVEFDTPRNLLNKEGGWFKALVDESGDREALYAMAAGT